MKVVESFYATHAKSGDATRVGGAGFDPLLTPTRRKCRMIAPALSTRPEILSATLAFAMRQNG